MAELANPNLTDDELKAVLLEAVEVVSAQPESDTTHLIARLCEIIVAQRLALIELQSAELPQPVVKRLHDAFLEGLDGARERGR